MLWRTGTCLVFSLAAQHSNCWDTNTSESVDQHERRISAMLRRSAQLHANRIVWNRGR